MVPETRTRTGDGIVRQRFFNWRCDCAVHYCADLSAMGLATSVHHSGHFGFLLADFVAAILLFARNTSAREQRRTGNDSAGQARIVAGTERHATASPKLAGSAQAAADVGHDCVEG